MTVPSFDLREQIVRIDRDLAETEKLIAEARTFSAEQNLPSIAEHSATDSCSQGIPFKVSPFICRIEHTLNNRGYIDGGGLNVQLKRHWWIHVVVATP